MEFLYRGGCATGFGLADRVFATDHGISQAGGLDLSRITSWGGWDTWISLDPSCGSRRSNL